MTTVSTWVDDIHLIGVGGIGTHVLLMLNELGARTVHIWDDDVVSPHNIPNQFMYTKSDVGLPKVEAAVRYAERQEWDTIIVPHTQRVDGLTRLHTLLSGIVISAVDSMDSRDGIWDAVQNRRAFIPIYIDGRIIDHYVHVLTVDPSDPVKIERYKRSLVHYLKNSVADDDHRCSTRENPHSAMRVASMTSINLTLLLKGEPVKDAVYCDLRLEAIHVQKQLAVQH